jgi:hypothetical protein
VEAVGVLVTPADKTVAMGDPVVVVVVKVQALELRVRPDRATMALGQLGKVLLGVVLAVGPEAQHLEPEEWWAQDLL